MFSLKIYAVLGAFLWFFVLESGLHATLAGVRLALAAGIGFTMSLFVSNLAFGNEELLTQAKLGVLLASVAAAVLGAGWLLVVSKPGAEREGELTSDG